MSERVHELADALWHIAGQLPHGWSLEIEADRKRGGMVLTMRAQEDGQRHCIHRHIGRMEFPWDVAGWVEAMRDYIRGAILAARSTPTESETK